MNLDAALLAFWRLTDRFEGLPPSGRDFVKECGLVSSSAGAYWFDALETAGLIYCPPALKEIGYRPPRSLKLSPEGIRRAQALMQGAA